MKKKILILILTSYVKPSISSDSCKITDSIKSATIQNSKSLQDNFWCDENEIISYMLFFSLIILILILTILIDRIIDYLIIKKLKKKYNVDENNYKIFIQNIFDLHSKYSSKEIDLSNDSKKIEFQEKLNENIEIILKSKYEKDTNLIKHDLEYSAEKHRVSGYYIVLFMIATLVFIIFSTNFKVVPQQANQLISNPNHSHTLLIYFVSRAFLLTSLFSGCLYFLYQIIIRSFDQSVRYTKRLESINFLEYLFNKGFKVDKSVKLYDFMNAYDKWTKTVESAFSKDDKKQQTEAIIKDGDREFKIKN